MILVDTSVWIDHFRSGDPVLQKLLVAGQVLSHPYVVGEVGMGSLKHRALVLRDLSRLPQAVVARHEEVMQFIHNEMLFGVGIGYVDAHLLAATRMTGGALLWTRDKRLREIAAKLRLAAAEK